MENVGSTGNLNSTFVIQVKGNSNHSCQGVIKWIEEGRTEVFRSYLELIQIINSTSCEV